MRTPAAIRGRSRWPPACSRWSAAGTEAGFGGPREPFLERNVVRVGQIGGAHQGDEVGAPIGMDRHGAGTAELAAQDPEDLLDAVPVALDRDVHPVEARLLVRSEERRVGKEARSR